MENSTLKNTTIVFRHKMYTKGFSPEQNELSYREAFVNPIIARSFNDVDSSKWLSCLRIFKRPTSLDIDNIIKFKTGEIETLTQKTQKNGTIKNTT
ncbi:13547_t:CDS:2 [Entrophospora sp. SA101]|nr:13547_t:CDS:2 [Entrophospora sp. SA101]